MTTTPRVSPFEPTRGQRELAWLLRRIETLARELQEPRRRALPSSEVAAKERTLEQLRWQLASVARRTANDELDDTA
jgi:hypothetical protein